MCAIAAMFSSCGDSGEDTPSQPIGMIRQTIAENQEVDAAETSSVAFTYNATIALADNSNITLNGEPLQASVSGMVLTIPLALSDGQEYTLQIPAGAVCSQADRSVVAAAFTLHFTTKAGVATSIDRSLINASATKEARNVYAFLLEQYGKKTLSGAMARVNNNNYQCDWISAKTGHYPALAGYDFIHLADSPANWIDYSDISPAREQWSNNGLVSYMWHWNVPSVEGGTDLQFNAGSTTFSITRALTDGTWENRQLLADIDKVAGYLKLLQDANIPVIWRPLHEASGKWFWWGKEGAEPCKQLWRLLYDRLVNHHGLNNLIWVWTVTVGEYVTEDPAAWYPGDDYCDIVGADIYYPDEQWNASKIKSAIEKVCNGQKMVTLSETGLLESSERGFSAADGWSWFMEWYDYDLTDASTADSFGNTVAGYQSIMSDSRVIDRENMPTLK